MSGWKEIVQDHIVRNYDRVRRVTKPLQEHFGVAYFTYHRIDEKGNYSVLLDRPDWAEHYVSEELFAEDPYLRHPEVYRSGLCLMEQHGSPDYKKQILKSGKEVLDCDLGVILVEKSPNFVEFFGFCGNRAKGALEKLYLNHSHLLHTFASHFTKELADLIATMQEAAFSLPKIKGKDFHSKKPVHPAVSDYTSFLSDLGYRKEIALAQSLSKRERECLQLLIIGHSAKEIAAALGLSQRTVEYYFENIRRKLNCWTKLDLFHLGLKFQEFGLLNA